MHFLRACLRKKEVYFLSLVALCGGLFSYVFSNTSFDIKTSEATTKQSTSKMPSLTIASDQCNMPASQVEGENPNKHLFVSCGGFLE